MNLARKLSVVPNETPEPPYPGDVLARGWNFTLQVERIKQSTTWTKCKPREMRAYLLRLWMESWQQSPCGTLPNDDEEIADLIEIDPGIFSARREVLMRGWYLATDGRLYHPVVTELVEEMRDGRKKERDKKARQRAEAAARAAAAAGESPGTTPGLPEESTGSPATGSGSGSGSGSGEPPSEVRSAKPPTQPKKAPKRAARRAEELAMLIEQGVGAELAGEWLEVRHEKGLVLTKTAIKGLRREADQAGLTVHEAVNTAVENSWGGFNHAWLARLKEPARKGPKETAYTADKKAQANAWMGVHARRVDDPNTIDMEGTDATGPRLS